MSPHQSITIGILIAAITVGFVVGCSSKPGESQEDEVAPATPTKQETATPASDEGRMTTSQPDDPNQQSPADAMRGLRRMMLTTSPKEFGVDNLDSESQVYGVLMEFSIGEHIATIVSLIDGNASLYTTSTFGILGGFGHENVRTAAMTFVKAANAHYDIAVPTTEYPYPDSDRVRFYLLTRTGVRFIDTPRAGIESGNDKEHSQLFSLGQEVLTQLRLITHGNE